MSLKDNLISTKSKITTIRDGLVQTLKDKNVDVDVNVTLSDAAKAVSSIKIGIDTSSANATSNDILIGKTAYVKGEKIEGNITSVSEKTYTPTNSDVVINSGVYLSGNQTIKGDSNLKSENIAKDITIFGITGTHEGGVNTNDATANSSDIIIGKTAYVKGEKIEGTLEESVVAVDNNEVYVSPGYIKKGKNYVIGNSLGESIYTPSNSDQIISSGNYLIGNQIIKGDTDLISQNIKSGVSIFGVDGNFTSDANATSNDILKGKTSYVNGKKLTGTIESISPVVNSNSVTITKGYISKEETITIGNTVNGKTIVPSTESQKIEKGSYLNGDVIVSGDTSLVSENIKHGISIFNTSGSFTSDADATAEDILKDKVAYVKGNKVVGTAEFSAQEEIVAGYFVNNSDGTVSFHSLDGNNEQISEISIVDTGVDEPDYSSSQGGGKTVDVTLGQVNAEGKFQPLTFNGTEASNSGNPEAVEAYHGFNGVLPVPESGGGSVGCDYYKCASVDTVNKTWTGYKAVLTDGVYTFESTATTGLTYGAAYAPMVGIIYSTDCTVRCNLYTGYPLYSTPINPTANTFGEWIMSAESYWDSGTMIYYAFTDNSKHWHSVGNLPTWIQWQNVNTKVLIKSYVVRFRSDHIPINFTLQGSNDGATWVDIDVVNNSSGVATIERTISDNTLAYYYHRFYFDTDAQSNYVVIEYLRAYSSETGDNI